MVPKIMLADNLSNPSSCHYIYISVNPDKTFKVLKGQKLKQLVFRKGKQKVNPPETSLLTNTTDTELLVRHQARERVYLFFQFHHGLF